MCYLIVGFYLFKCIECLYAGNNKLVMHLFLIFPFNFRPINTRFMDSDSESEDELRTACFAKKRLVATVDSVE